jgi:hypothetical protein
MFEGLEWCYQFVCLFLDISIFKLIMIKLTTLIFVICFICGGVNAQDWSFDDLRNLDSKEAFIQKVNEKGFSFDFENHKMLAYTEQKEQFIIAEYQTIKSYSGILGYKGDWAFSFFLPETYQKIYNDVKKECKFSDVSDYRSLSFSNDSKLNNVVFYSCPNSTYKGKIGFVRKDDAHIVVHRSKIYNQEEHIRENRRRAGSK